VGLTSQILTALTLALALSLSLSLCETLQKRFIKGLRQFGKNFFRIRKELLPNKETVRRFKSPYAVEV